MARRAFDEEVEVLPELTLPPIPRWDQIVGQDRAVEVLQAALASGRAHHAWLFAGPPGVGKFTTALAFASCLMDPTSAANLGGLIEPDPASPTQERLRAGAHPDLHVVRKELALYSSDSKARAAKLASIPIAVIREHLLEPAYRAPHISRDAIAPKVFIVDEAELLDRSPNNAPVQNAILKTMEEPPPGTVVILLTTSEERLLPTIRSRCQRLTFRTLTDDEMAAWLASSGTAVPPGSRDWLLRVAQGSPGRLGEAIEAGLDSWAEPLAPILAAFDAGRPVIELGPTAARLIDGYATAWSKAGKNRSKEVGNRRAARQLLALRAGHFARGLRAGRDPEWSARAVLRCERTERDLSSFVQPALAFDALAADLSVTHAAR
jgi:DNA polymerase-3 subunit delta'